MGENKPKMETGLLHLARMVKGKILGNSKLRISGMNTLDEAQSGEMAFIHQSRYEKHALSTRASVILAHKAIPDLKKTFLLVDHPALATVQIIRFFHPEQRYPAGIDPRAVLGHPVVLGKGVAIGPYVVIHDRVKIGNDVQIFPGVVVGSDSEIGDGTILYSNVTLYERVKIGRRVIIHSGSVIGADGFGFIPDQIQHLKVPQVGAVAIEDDVELGANVTVDRATFGVTRVGQGTKVDDHVHIGHNVKIGPHTLIVAQVGIAGSVEIGHHVTLAGQVGVSDHVKIGNHVVVGARSVVTKNIPNEAKVTGFPPLPHKKWLLAQASMQYLPELRKAVTILNGKIASLEKKLA